jgi:hypothetical protein
MIGAQGEVERTLRWLRPPTTPSGRWGPMSLGSAARWQRREPRRCQFCAGLPTAERLSNAALPASATRDRSTPKPSLAST